MDSFIKKHLGTATGVDVDALKQENEQLKKANADLTKRVEELTKKVSISSWFRLLAPPYTPVYTSFELKVLTLQSDHFKRIIDWDLFQLEAAGGEENKSWAVDETNKHNIDSTTTV